MCYRPAVNSRKLVRLMIVGNHVLPKDTPCPEKQCLPMEVLLSEAKTVTVYFLCHAESEWNHVTDNSFSTKLESEFRNGNVPGFEYLTDAHLSDQGLEGAIKVRDEQTGG